MAEAIAFPSLPPASPWDAYLLMLAIPLIMRVVFVAPPLIDLVNTYAPPGERTKHVKWFFARLKQLPIEGFWLIVTNEILAVYKIGAPRPNIGSVAAPASSNQWASAADGEGT